MSGQFEDVGKDVRLEGKVVDAAGAATEFGAVDNEIIMVRDGEGGVCGEERDVVRGKGRGEGVVSGC